jgi:hypothetical protein
MEFSTHTCKFNSRHIYFSLIEQISEIKKFITVNKKALKTTEVNKTHTTKCSVHNQTQNLSQDWKDTCESFSCEKLIEVKPTVPFNVTSCTLKWAMVSRPVFRYRFTNGGRYRAVATETRCGRTGPGINQCDGEIFRAVQNGPEGNATSYKMGTRSFLGAKAWY